VSCNLCGWQGNQFYPFTDQNVGLFLDELCPNCGSWARHRSCWHYLQAEIDRLKSRKFKVLEIGPSGGLGKILKSIPQAAYIGIDIQFLPQTDICGDVIRLPFQDNSFDLVICFNVLNAIPNDSSAVAEMGRVCQSGGKVILSDAVDERLAETIEFDCPQAEKHGAVHWYGRDFVERFSKPELNFREDRYTFGLPPDIVQRQGLSRRILFLAEKQAGELACASVLSR
jgi:SAM-dependent methyltransferase